MKIAVIVMAVAVVSLSALGWTPASAQTTSTNTAPIQVTNLQYTGPISTDEDDGGSDGDLRPGLMLTFKNITSRPIHTVVFAVTDASGYQLGTVSRHGTFSPGVSIMRYFGDLPLKHKHGSPAKATPVLVGFKDGTSWSSTNSSAP